MQGASLMGEYESLSPEDLETLKNKITSEIEHISIRTSDSVSTLEKEELTDPVDEANSNIRVSHDLRMKNRELFYLKKLKSSLDRFNRKKYGFCNECGVEISFERLMARPTAEQCISCKEEAEIQEKSNIFDRRSKSLGKSLQEMSVR